MRLGLPEVGGSGGGGGGGGRDLWVSLLEGRKQDGNGEEC